LSPKLISYQIKNLRKKSSKTKRIDQSKEFGWEDEEKRKHVILKNVFHPDNSAGDPNFFLDLKNDIKEECSKLGHVESVKVFERNALGVVAVKFKNGEAAARCLGLMNGRVFDGHKISAEWYDEITNYAVSEKPEDEKVRIDAFGKWLETDS